MNCQSEKWLAVLMAWHFLRPSQIKLHVEVASVAILGTVMKVVQEVVEAVTPPTVIIILQQR